MAQENGEKPDVAAGSNNQQLVGKNNNTSNYKPKDYYNWVIALLRLLAFGATISATLVMALNKQKKTFVVATIGTTPIQATLTAKFQHTPAFVFFVIANGLCSLHNLLMLAACFIGSKYDFKGLRFYVIGVLDMMNVALVSGGASAAAFMGQLGKDGNSHARWNKICDKFDIYCSHGEGAIIVSFIGLLLMIITTAITIIKLKNIQYSGSCAIIP
ncbi:PREDICTED: CASP-like protein 1B2 [Nicotiana attenuata]|uniref:CASP-like protein n=1 Tax=Nicotiana attenuata TaxID=49451 RepID=A0A1J6IMU4_NICAT|nr:PREDICTED: CASP-like protein 1B2 [Nicotiana attenuata]OIT06166.1 casp-like protein 1b2 [Nicotiana attenuata]